MAREKVAYLKVGTDAGPGPFSDFGWIQTRGGELYYLWWDDAFPDETTAAHHVRRSLWVSLVRDAIVNDLDIEIITDTPSSAKVLTVVLHSA